MTTSVAVRQRRVRFLLRRPLPRGRCPHLHFRVGEPPAVCTIFQPGREWNLPYREEVLVTALQLTLQIAPGPQPGAVVVRVESFDPIVVTAAQRILLRPEGHGVVLERETLPQ